MPRIILSTTINAPRERVFDLARNIDAHQSSTGQTRERAIAGVTSGLVGMGDRVTWEARHFWVKQTLTVRITAFDRPNFFRDVMVEGAFKQMSHNHNFVEVPSGTEMIDCFEFESPFGMLGRIFDRFCLCGYLRRFLIQRNLQLKRFAESEEWRMYLGASVNRSFGRTVDSTHLPMPGKPLFP